MRWHRQLVATKYDGSRGKLGRPTVGLEIGTLVVRMAKEDPSWGYTRIRGVLSNLGHALGRNTIARILQDHGIEPAPRRVKILGIIPEPDGRWMEQVARNTTDGIDGFLTGKRCMIIDRDSRFTEEFCSILNVSGVTIIRTPPRSPNLNAFAERFVRSIKEECLSRMLFFSERQLRTAVSEYAEHYHRERNHQGLANKLIEPANGAGKVVRDSRLGGLLNHYRRAA